MYTDLPRISFWFLLLFAVAVASQAAQTLIGTNAAWRYLDTGTNLGTAWRPSEFDSSGWNSGPAQLGFGEGDEATVINGGPSGARFATIYFRHAFVINDVAVLTNAAIRLLRDDGAVVYVNGVEAFRQNMPEGIIHAGDLANGAAQGTDETTFFAEPISPSLFVPGTNVVAVEVHQSDPSSSDLSFALELLANTPLGNFPPIVMIETPLNGAVVEPGQSFLVRASASDVDGVIQSIALLRDGIVVASASGSTLTWTNAPLASGMLLFVARALDAQGAIVSSSTNGISARPPGRHLVSFPLFTTETNLVLHRSSYVSEGRLHLNPANGGTGGAYVPAKQFIRDGFDVIFRYDIRDIVNTGGDGISLVIQNNPFLVDGQGAGSIGYSGIPNSLAVEFDTWGNPEAADPSSSHISVHTRGTLPNDSNHAYSIGSATGFGSLNGVHTVRVIYVPPVLNVFFDNTNSPLLSVTNDLSVLFPLDFGRAWIGLGSGTGAGIESHDILSWSITTPEWIRTKILSPASQQILSAPVSTLVQASASAFTGSVTHVEFYDDGVKFADDVAPPYEAAWNTARVGRHQLVAVAYDSAGNSTPSEPVDVYVQEGDGRRTLVPPGSFWRFHDRGADWGESWRSNHFADLTWRLGPAEFGFGDGDEVTLLNGGPSTDRFRTTYFRRSFQVTNVADIGGLSIRLRRDDGALIYLNEVEVFRNNMPLGSISYTTLSATAAQGTNETNYFFTNAPAAMLVEGVNTLAVEVHQSDAASSDLSFDLELIASSALRLTSPRLIDGRAKLFLRTQPGRRYQVQFSSDLNQWFNAGAAFTATNLNTLWIDAGPPTTPTPPASASQRFYKARLEP